MSGAKPKTSQKSSSKPVPDSSHISQNQDETFFKNDAEEKKFLEWFWKGSNGNNLVRKLNGYAQRNDKDRIRREKESPVVYAVDLDTGKFSFEEGGKQWKLCKVGFTHRSIKKGTGNRMEHVCQRIEKELPGAEPEILFAIPIGAVDTTPFSQTENRIREKVGKPVHKNMAKEFGLPVPTEWVLTTQEHIDTIKQIMKKEKKKTKDVDESGDLIDIFKSIKITPEPPEELYKELCTK